MKAYSKPKYEVADILGKYGQAYRSARKLQLSDHKVLNAIESCRTIALGGHLDQCSDCDHQRNAYNSCRNRHCPKCQGMNQLKWVDKMAANLLPVRYFHLVFTIPHELNSLCLMNKKQLYGILFKAAAETVTMLCKDKKHLGATPGLISVLHTWGQNLMEHPHVHMIVTAGGISINGDRWIHSGKKFFLPVRVLSRVFRGKFLAKLKQVYSKSDLKMVGNNLDLNSKERFQQLADTLYQKPWIVYAKKPFGGVGNVLRYLGRYTHRIAISNHRIVAIDDGTVRFKWKDYADHNTQKVMPLKAGEFIRRFLLHTLPRGLCKLRYCGITANRNKKMNLALVRKWMNAPAPVYIGSDEKWQETLLRLTGFDVHVCPKCKKGQMKTIMVFEKRFPS